MNLNLTRVNILGVSINAMTMSQAIAQIKSWIDHQAQEYVCVCPVHTIMECQRSEVMRQVVNEAGMATPDGMPLVWLGRLKSNNEVSRVYGPDLMLTLCEESVQYGYKHYFYGGAEGVPELLVAKLQEKFPGLKVAGSYSPPFRKLTSDEILDITQTINETAPDIIWVGLGTPKQDLWMNQNRDKLTASVLIGVGAAFDFHTERIPQAPRWMQQNGLEWFFRLYQEPRRLWYRYLVYNPLFVLLILAQMLGLKRYRIP